MDSSLSSLHAPRAHPSSPPLPCKRSSQRNVPLVPTGATYFVHRLHEQRAVPPVHVHVTYTMGADFGKRFRLKEAGLWLDAPLDGRAEGAKAQGAAAAVAADGRGGGRPSKGFVKVTWALIASSDCP
jgi:hypothetical protein